MLPSWCKDSVTVLRAPLVDTRGVFVRDWSMVQSHIVDGCSLQPVSSDTTDGEPRNNIASTARLFAPFGADIEKDDRIVFEGVTWSVEGCPFHRKSPFGGADHMVADLSSWSG